MVRLSAGRGVDVSFAEPGSGGCRDGPTLRDDETAVRVIIEHPMNIGGHQNWK
jgi:hypothetical protein